MKFLLKILLAVLLIIVLFYLFFRFTDVLFAPTSGMETQDKICYKDSCFTVELADTAQRREVGLMFRTQLDKDSGMLFIFENEEVYPFWMENTLIPLDIIWMDKNQKVVFINENSHPCRSENCPLIIPGVKATYVLEINAGVSKKIGLKIGDKLDLSF